MNDRVRLQLVERESAEALRGIDFPIDEWDVRKANAQRREIELAERENALELDEHDFKIKYTVCRLTLLLWAAVEFGAFLWILRIAEEIGRPLWR